MVSLLSCDICYKKDKESWVAETKREVQEHFSESRERIRRVCQREMPKNGLLRFVAKLYALILIPLFHMV